MVTHQSSSLRSYSHQGVILQHFTSYGSTSYLGCHTYSVNIYYLCKTHKIISKYIHILITRFFCLFYFYVSIAHRLRLEGITFFIYSISFTKKATICCMLSKMYLTTLSVSGTVTFILTINNLTLASCDNFCSPIHILKASYRSPLKQESQNISFYTIPYIMLTLIFTPLVNYTFLH